MGGRFVCWNPFFLTPFEKRGRLRQQPGGFSREAIITRYLPYILREYQKGTPMRNLTRHLIGLYQGEPGARAWRRLLSENCEDDCQLVRAIEQLSSIVDSREYTAQ